MTPLHNALRACAAACVLAAVPRASPAAAPGAGTCWVQGTALSFGAYQPLAGSDTLGHAVLQLSCSGAAHGLAYRLLLGPGHGAPSALDRRMPHAGHGPALRFNVYLDPSHTQVWGDGFQGRAIHGVTPGGALIRSHAAYGKIPGGQTHLPAGDYRVSLPITVVYEP